MRTLFSSCTFSLIFIILFANDTFSCFDCTNCAGILLNDKRYICPLSCTENMTVIGNSCKCISNGEQIPCETCPAWSDVFQTAEFAVDLSSNCEGELGFMVLCENGSVGGLQFVEDKNGIVNVKVECHNSSLFGTDYFLGSFGQPLQCHRSFFHGFAIVEDEHHRIRNLKALCSDMTYTNSTNKYGLERAHLKSPWNKLATCPPHHILSGINFRKKQDEPYMLNLRLYCEITRYVPPTDIFNTVPTRACVVLCKDGTSVSCGDRCPVIQSSTRST